MINTFHNLLQEAWYDVKPGFPASALKTIFTPFSTVYAFFAARNRHNAKQEKLSTPVISIGNLTVGGTGKTTFVIECNNLLTQEGLSGVILTRGHGRKSNKPVFLNRNITQLPDSRETGDEPLVLYRQCNGTPVLVGANRSENFKKYVSYSSKPDFVLLDDGLHHHAIHKGLNICLIDGKRLLGNGNCLPAGPLREPLSITPKPDVIIVTRYDESADMKQILSTFPNVPLLKTSFGIQSFTLLSGVEETAIPGKNVLLVSALGDNDQFRQNVEKKGFDVAEHCQFPDHYPFTANDVSRIEEAARAKGVQTILTTWKDAVKTKKWIKPEGESNIKWYACNLAVVYEENGQDLLKKILMKAFI